AGSGEPRKTRGHRPDRGPEELSQAHTAALPTMAKLRPAWPRRQRRSARDPSPAPGRKLERVFAPTTSERRGRRTHPRETPQTAKERTGKRNRDEFHRIGHARERTRGRTHNPRRQPPAPNDGGSPTRRTSPPGQGDKKTTRN